MSSLWLDQDYYLQQQLAQIQAANPDSSITTTSALLTALSEEGKTVAQSFVETGWKSGFDPSAGFDVSYYIEQLADETGIEYSAAKELLEASGMDPVTHYQLIGASLGLDTSKNFDTSYYLEQKAEFLNNQSFMGKTDWTSAEALTLMQVTGLDPLTDYQTVGWLQGLSPLEGFDTDEFYSLLAESSNLTVDQIPIFLALAGSDPLSYILTYGLPDTGDDASSSTTSTTGTSTSSTTSHSSTTSSTVSLAATVDADGVLHLSDAAWAAPYVYLGNSAKVVDGSSSVAIHDANGSTYSGTLTHVDLSNLTADTHVIGSSHADTIITGSGDDVINGGAGTDTLTGGAGSDTFVFENITSSANAKVIKDFEAGSGGDVLQFDTATYSDYTAGNAHIVNSATVAKATAWDNYVVVDSNDNIMGMDLSDLTHDQAVLAIASDTGAILYDADGDFSSGVVIIGSLTPTEVASLVAGNVQFV